MSKFFINMTLVLALFSCTPAKRKIASIHSEDDELGYCISVRGNGQRMASLWGAMARTVESYGMPSVISGGSSSTYTMFLTESIAMNPYIKTKEEASFLLKSMMGYIDYMADTKYFRDILIAIKDPESKRVLDALMNDLKAVGNLSGVRKIFGQIKLGWRVLIDKRKRRIAGIFNNDDTKMLMNAELFEEYLNAEEETIRLEAIINSSSSTTEQVKAAIEELNNILSYRNNQLQLALQYFGNYNIQENKNIFFRPGPMDFLGFAKLFNRAANFYAGRGHTDQIARDFRSWLDLCSGNTIGKQWHDITNQNNRCRTKFDRLVSKFLIEQRASEKGYKRIRIGNRPGSRINQYRNEPFQFDQRIDDVIGVKIKTIPTTGILIGQGAQRFKSMMSEFKSTTDPDFGESFVASIEDVKIGYWSDERTLQDIEKNLNSSFFDFYNQELDFTQDFKSSLFYPLYNAKWSEVFVTSPAEPSLTNIRNMPRRDDIVSIGGWMDHLSAPVLKSAGCERVVTFTKGDGQGSFGAGMLKRIANLQTPSWDELKLRAKNGDPSDTQSIWGKYQNMQNPESSYNTAMNAADAILCLNYDLLEFGKDSLAAFFDNGYMAPVFLKSYTSTDGLGQHAFNSVITRANFNDEKYPVKSCMPFFE
jgi:hypothetical protein